MARTVLVAVLCVAGVQALAAGNLYRWKDANGNLVVSDRPPPGGEEFETISTRSNLVHNVEAEKADKAESSVSVDSGTASRKSAAASSKSAIHEKNPEYCKAARANLEVIDTAARIRVKGDDGEMRYITDEERAQQRQQALDVIEAHCE
ncbi:DUF4124 domain-containing protein [Mangrovimicrobium sediminis]|uniref:DUF4124 domain-containing protein n=1 Tax=Mangrovimicrobium sediminis TaxID=2562682 RepID=A0A4Z0LWE4_9GAMM|nr:DUF4124 domain-containing protein [Haliea sp. SAOS-164]TGD71579.1 DUF4124 domain-containing protein [Haliea sp. SAOS-164]